MFGPISKIISFSSICSKLLFLPSPSNFFPTIQSSGIVILQLVFDMVLEQVKKPFTKPAVRAREDEENEKVKTDLGGESPKSNEGEGADRKMA